MTKAMFSETDEVNFADEAIAAEALNEIDGAVCDISEEFDFDQRASHFAYTGEPGEPVFGPWEGSPKPGDPDYQVFYLDLGANNQNATAENTGYDKMKDLRRGDR